MSKIWDTDALHPRDVITPDPEERRREHIEDVARGLAELKAGESIKVEAHENGSWTVTFTAPDGPTY